VHALHEPLVGLGDRGAEDLVAGHDLGEGPVERPHVQGAGQADRELVVVRHARARHLAHQPDRLLLEGDGQRTAPRLGDDRRRDVQGNGAPGSAQTPQRDEFRDPRDRRVRQHRFERDVDAGNLLQPAGEPQGRERVAARLQEAVVDADAADAEDLAPDRRHPLLQSVPRRGPLAGLLHGFLWSRESPEIDLAVRSERQTAEQHEQRGNHEFRQVLPGPGAQARREIAGVLRTVGRRHHISHQAALPRLIAAHGRRGGFDERMPGEDPFDLGQLDAETAQLHLAVLAPGEFQAAVGAQPREVAGGVEPLPGAAARVREEPLGRQVRPPEIAAREPFSADVHLAGLAVAHLTTLLVQQEHLHVRNGAADRQLAGAHLSVTLTGDRRREVAHRGHDRGFRGAVGVHQAHPAADLPLPHLEPLGKGALRADDHQAHGRRPGQVLRLEPEHQLVPVGRGDADRGDPPGPALGQEAGDGAEHGVVTQHEARAGRQRDPDLLQAGVEAERGELQHAVTRTDRVFRHRLAQVVDQRALRNRHPLRPAGRARGIHHVSGLPAAQPEGWIRNRRIDQRHRLGVQRDHAGNRCGEPLRELPVRQDHPHGGVFDHERQTFLRIGRIERKERAARFRDREHRDDRFRRAWGVNSHRDLGLDTERGEIERQPRSPAVEVVIRDRSFAMDDGGCIGMPSGLRFDQVVETEILRGAACEDLRDGGPAFVLSRNVHRSSSPVLERGGQIPFRLTDEKSKSRARGRNTPSPLWTEAIRKIFRHVSPGD
jgi:hypothetical protein